MEPVATDKWIEFKSSYEPDLCCVGLLLFNSTSRMKLRQVGEGETEKKYKCKCMLLRCLLWSQILSRTTSMSGDHNTECNTPSHRAWWGNPGDGYTVSITDTDTECAG